MTRIAAALMLSLLVAAGAAALGQDFFGGRREPLHDLGIDPSQQDRCGNPGADCEAERPDQPRTCVQMTTCRFLARR